MVIIVVLLMVMGGAVGDDCRGDVDDSVDDDGDGMFRWCGGKATWGNEDMERRGGMATLLELVLLVHDISCR